MSHLRVRALPYTFSDFIVYVDELIALYKASGIVTEECHELLDAVVRSLHEERDRLMYRLHNWDKIEKDEAMLAEVRRASLDQVELRSARAKFVAGVRYAAAIQSNKHRIQLDDVIQGVVARRELNRLRAMDVHEEYSVGNLE